MKTKSICLALAIALLCPFASAQWVHTSLPDTLGVSCFAVSGTNLFAGTGLTPWDPSHCHGVFLSTNNGTSWTAVNTGLTDSAVSSIVLFGTNLLAGTGEGIFLSTNNGTSWTLDTNLSRVRSFAISGTNLFAGGQDVFVSTNDGTSWRDIGFVGYYVMAVAVCGTSIYAGTPVGISLWSGGVFRTTNGGSSWTAVKTGLPPMGLNGTTSINALAVQGTNIFAGTAGVFRITNNDTTWTQAGLTNEGINCLVVSGTNLFAGGSGGVFLSTDNGTSWTAVNTGLTDTIVYSLAVSATNLFAGTGSGVWRRPLSELVSVNLKSSELPAEFVLSQNYPNPFNPSTTIKFELPRASHVSLTVYDILGRQGSVLVNERRNAGVHEVKFEGSSLASGVYFYRLQAEDFVSTKKFVLLK